MAVEAGGQPCLGNVALELKGLVRFKSAGNGRECFQSDLMAILILILATCS